MAKLNNHKQLSREEKQRRDMFTAAALTGLCATPAGIKAGQNPQIPSQLGTLAMVIADATIAPLDNIAPPSLKRLDDELQP